MITQKITKFVDGSNRVFVVEDGEFKTIIKGKETTHETKEQALTVLNVVERKLDDQESQERQRAKSRADSDGEQAPEPITEDAKESTEKERPKVKKRKGKKV